MHRFIVRALAAFGLAASVSAAQAGTLTYSSYSVYNGQNVFLSLNQAAPLPSTHEWAGAGEIVLFTNDVLGGALGVWCIDIPDTLRQSGTFTTGQVLSGQFAYAVNALLTNVLPDLAKDAWTSAALQVAIWQSEYGSALKVDGPSEVTSRAAQYVKNVQNGTFRPDPTKQVSVLAAIGTNQDQAYLTAVPEPGSIALVGGGLLAVAVVRRRRLGTKATFANSRSRTSL